MFKYKLITEEHNLSSKKVLLRLDLNVPVKDKVSDHIRLEKALEMVNYLRLHGSRVIIISHIGREKDETLFPLVSFFEKYFKVCFEEDVYGKDLKKKIDQMENGDVLMIENLRKWDEEVNNDEEFGKHLASLADIYVNEAFAVSHRAHASVSVTPRHLPSFAGIHFDKEVKNLCKALHPERPFVAIIGGAKFETKIPLIKKFFNLADHLIVIGALANDVYRFRGYNMNSSMVSSVPLKEIEDISLSEKVIIPSEVLVLNGKVVINKKAKDVLGHEKVVDAGRSTMKEVKEVIGKAKMIVWNGPFGMYEQGYITETKKFAKLLAESKALTIVGGGDTLASIRECGLDDNFTFVSTAGGAMLEFLKNETLPGIEALQ